MCLNSDIQVSETSIIHCNAGACWVTAKPWNDIVVKDCDIHDCQVVGIYCQGEGGN